MDYNLGYVSKVPTISSANHKLVLDCIAISKEDWDSSETSWDFIQNELVRFQSQHSSDGLVTSLEEAYDLYKFYWTNKFHQMHLKEEELNREFIELYGLQNDLTPDVPLENISILKEVSEMVNGNVMFDSQRVFSQLISYFLGCTFGRYSLEKKGLILANQGETLQDYVIKVGKSHNEISFLPDDDNIIPVLDDEWFEDDIVGRFHEFLKASFGEKNFVKNHQFVEDCLGKDIRKYLTKDFYKDHIKRYKKRPIYWMFSSPKGHFKVLVYLHRYTPDTLSRILNNYLREFMSKLSSEKERQQDIVVTGAPREQAKALMEIDKIEKQIDDCLEYEAILRELALERIELDLDDGVLVNYNKMGKAVATVPGLNDAKAKKKVRGFDWIDTTQIR